MSVMNTMDLAPMRELTIDEIDEVSGGILPIVGVTGFAAGFGLGLGLALGGGIVIGAGIGAAYYLGYFGGSGSGSSSSGGFTKADLDLNDIQVHVA